MGFRKMFHISKSSETGSEPREAGPETQEAVLEQEAAEIVTEAEGAVPDPGPQSSRSKMSLFL
jgi:hypothetical protein